MKIDEGMECTHISYIDQQIIIIIIGLTPVLGIAAGSLVFIYIVYMERNVSVNKRREAER